MVNSVNERLLKAIQSKLSSFFMKRDIKVIVMQGKKLSLPKRHRISQHRLIRNIASQVSIKHGFLQSEPPWPSKNPSENTVYLSTVL